MILFEIVKQISAYAQVIFFKIVMQKKKPKKYGPQSKKELIFQIVTANDLPFRLNQHTTLKYQDSFLILGGNQFLDANCNEPTCGCTKGQASDAIYK